MPGSLLGAGSRRPIRGHPDPSLVPGLGVAGRGRVGPAMSAEPKIVTSDFYDLEALLDDDDRALLHRVRAFMDKQVQPIINEYWTRGKFPRS